MAAPLPPEDILAALDVSEPVFAAETGAALIWRVRKGAGQAALKLYKTGDMGNEAPGFRYLAALNGQGAARVFHAQDGVALTSWLDGPPLSALATEGRDAEMIERLAEVAHGLHRCQVPGNNGFTRLSTFMASLFSFTPPAGWAAAQRRDFAACQMLGRVLLDSQTLPQPLHGDLHPGNVIQTAGGLCVFDAKGLWGEPAYELANAFRHPRGQPELILDPARQRHAAEVWAAALGCTPARLLQWGAAKAALSLAWRAGQGLETDMDFRLVRVLLAQAA